MKDGFTPSELQADYFTFKELVAMRVLAPDVQEWLGEWEMWDLACSPMDDNRRGLIRYGHYLGWFTLKRLRERA